MDVTLGVTSNQQMILLGCEDSSYFFRHPKQVLAKIQFSPSKFIKDRLKKKI